MARRKQKPKKVMERTKNIYRHQALRHKGLLPYSISELRAKVQIAIDTEKGGKCPYCFGELSVENFQLDHREPVARGGRAALDNLTVCCAPCNQAKGPMTVGEFLALRALLAEFPPAVARHTLTRLRSGRAGGIKTPPPPVTA